MVGKTRARTGLVTAPRPLVWLAVGVGATALVAAHVLLAGQDAEFASPLMLIDRLFDVVFALVVALVALGIGRFCLKRWAVEDASPVAQTALNFAVGVGVLGLALLFLGLVGLLSPLMILGMLGAGLVLTFREWMGWGASVVQVSRTAAPLERAEKVLVVSLALLMLPILLATLTPPTDNDALAYHLAAPQMFLQQQAIVPSFENVGANYPIALDLVYLFGLAASSVIASQLMHYFCVVAIALGIYALVRARVSRRAALLACVIYWCSSVVGMEASTPIIDMAWGMYEFLAVYLLVRWWEKRNPRELVLIGVMLGLALSNKYLAMVGLGVAGALIFVKTIADEFKAQGWFKSIGVGMLSAAVPVVTALVVVSPWLLKNFFWLGNPIYPFVGGAFAWDGVLYRSAGNVGDWVGMGLGHDLAALVQFPYNVYVHWQYFNFGFNRGGPTLFFLLVPLYLFVPKRAFVNLLLVILAVRFMFWFAYAQNMRYLVVVFPMAAIVSAVVVDALWSRVRRPSLKFGMALLIGAFVLWGVVTQWGLLLVFRDQALGYLTGAVSRSAYLEANLLNYRAIRFINSALAQNAAVLAIGDQRLFYAERRVIPDDSHANWQRLAERAGTAEGIVTVLEQNGITHVWVSKDDLDYFRENWKIESPLHTELFQTFRDAHLQELYRDDSGHVIYRIETD